MFKKPMYLCRLALPSALPLLLATLVAAQAATRRVKVAKARTGPLVHKALLQAEVLALQSMQLVPRVSGQVQAILVKEGDLVPGGETLVRLHCPELEAEVTISEAALAKAQARVEVAAGMLVVAKETMQVAKADYSAQQVAEKVSVLAQKLAAIDQKRAEKLHAQRAATLEELEKAQLHAERAAADLEASKAASVAARARLSQAEAKVAVEEAEQRQAQAAVALAKAELQRARIFLGFASLKNPYCKSRISRQLTDAGNLARGDQTAILELLDVSKVRIRFAVPEVEAEYVTAGSALRIIQPHRPGADVEAKVTLVTAAIDRVSRTMWAEVELDNEAGRWLPGSLCKVEVVYQRLEKAVTIPSRGLFKEGGDVYVWCDNSGHARKQKVKVGIDFGKRVQILSGLEGSERVIVAGQSGLSSGQMVEAEEVEK